jgi:uncharacterized membrane protein
MQEQNENIYDTEIYDFSIVGLLKEGLNRTYGVKLKFIGAFLIYVIIAVISRAILDVIFPTDGSSVNSYISSFISVPITLPILVGLTMLGVMQARGEEIEIPSIFNYYNMLTPILLAYVMTTIFLSIGFILLILPGIYLIISYTFTYPLIVDKGLPFFEAMELSRKTITKQWFKFFALAMLSGFIIFLSALPFGIGLIWTIPMVYISYGLLYHHLFDDDEAVNEEEA